MKKIISLMVIFFFCSCSFTAPEEDFIQGSWSDGSITWVFDHGKYEIQGSVTEKGYYRFIKSAGQTISIEISPRHNNASRETHIIKIIMNKDAGTLMIRDQGPFKKL